MATKKKLIITTASLVAIFAIIFIGVFFFSKPIFEYGLRTAGFGQSTIERADFTLSGTTLKNIHLDGKNKVGQINLYSTVGDFMSGNMTKVEIMGPTLSWPMDLPSNGKAGGALTLFSKNIEVTHGRLNAMTPLGELPLDFKGSIIDKGTEYQANFDVKAAPNDFAELTGKLTINMVKLPRMMKIHLEINDGKLKHPDFEMKRITGFISADIDPDKPLPALSSQLDLGAMRVYGLPLQAVKLIAKTGDKTTVSLQGQVQNDSGDFGVEFSAQQKDTHTDAITLNANATLKNLDALELSGLKGRGNLMLAMSGQRARGDDLSDMTQWKALSGSMGIEMEKLSLPGLMKDAEALATARFDLDPVEQTIVADSTDGAINFSGVFKGIDTLPVLVNIPADAKAPPGLKWENKAKKLRIGFNNASFTGMKIVASRISADASVDLSGAPVVDGKVILGDVANMALGKMQAFIPVKVAVTMKPVGTGVTAITGTVTEKNGKINGEIAGKHDSAANKGELLLKIPPMQLLQAVSPLSSLSPITQFYIQEGYGTLGVSADVAWGKGKNGWVTGSRGQLYLKDFTANIRGNVLSGINTVMDIDSLSPLTLSKQQVAVGSLNVGLPLSNGATVISLDKKNVFTLHSATWDLAGGKISSTPFAMYMTDMAADVTLTATGLSLPELFKIAPMEGLNATGIVDGTLPLQIRGGTFTVYNGQLQTTGPGTISYNPKELPEFLKNPKQSQLLDLKTALTSFNYDSLGMTINGALGTSQKITLNIKGKNPLFYSGKPVNLNLNVEGPLENVLKYSPGSSRIPDAIRAQLEAWEKKNAKL
ncbi:MAG: YdbH domain-containing protein [Alphaproteobacteria bacterium]